MFVKLLEEVVVVLKQGENLIVIYCNNCVVNGLIDCGLLVEKDNIQNFIQIVVQKLVDVQVMQINYEFICGLVDLKFVFILFFFMDNFDLMICLVSYFIYEVVLNDGNKYNVELYFEVGLQWVFDQFYQEVVVESFIEGNLLYFKMGSCNQEILGKKGDDVCIDWGYFYMVVDKENSLCVIGEGKILRKSFIDGKLILFKIDGSDKLVLVCLLGEMKKVEGYLLLGYDDLYFIQYFGENFCLYWNCNGNEIIQLQFVKVDKEYDVVMDKCVVFDVNLMKEVIEVGGCKYVEFCVLVYCQVIVVYKLVEVFNKDLLFFLKENFSNGLIGMVDIIYFFVFLFLVYNLELVKGLMNYIFYYSESGKWNKLFVVYDVGIYLLVNGQIYGGDMLIEELGNMLILSVVIVIVEGNVDYVQKYWDVLIIWIDYLV